MIIQPHHLDGLAALEAASKERLCKQKGERDTAFVKRIVCAYLNASRELQRIRFEADKEALKRK